MSSLSQPTVKSGIVQLEERIVGLGRMVEAAIARAIYALVHRDTLLAGAIVQEDYQIDQAEIEVQELCVTLLETLRPTGADLRFIIAVLKINDSLERIADLAENVARLVLEVADWERFQQVSGIGEIAERTERMVADSLQSLVLRDTALAREVIAADDEVDTAQDRINVRIEALIDRTPENARPLMKLENAIRQFERMGDIATNIAEEVIYLIEGEIVRHRSGQ